MTCLWYAVDVPWWTCECVFSELLILSFVEVLLLVGAGSSLRLEYFVCSLL